LLEEEADDFQTPQYIDAVYQTAEGESSEEETAEVDAGTTDSSEPAFFESATVTQTATEGEWTAPEYSGDAAAPAAVETVEAEMTGFVEVGSDDEGEDGWSTPEYTNAQAEATGAKSYARIIVPAESEQSLIEAAATETVTSNAAASAEVKLFTPRIIRSRRSRHAGAKPIIFHTQKRYRSADAIVPRPRWNRHDPHTPRHMANRLIAGMALRNAEHVAYDRLEAYCSTRLPESYGKYCRPVLRKFRRITEGLSYGDHVNRVCMAANLCKSTSYITHSPHVRLESRT